MYRKNLLWIIGVFAITSLAVFLFNQHKVAKNAKETTIIRNENMNTQIKSSTDSATSSTMTQVNNVSLNPNRVIDTKIDPTIQPIPPEKDPSNTVRY